jgi:RNA polymerase sigma factor (sigma-70 family)
MAKDALGSFSDEELVSEIGRGRDRKAVATLLDRYGRFVFSVAFRSLGDPADAEDAAQNAWMDILEAAKRFQPKGTVRAWIGSIAVNKAREIHRKRRRTRDREMRVAQPESIPPDQSTESKEMQALVEAAVRELPDEEREIAILHYYEGLTQDEVSQAMHLPLSTVKWRISQTLEMLRSRLAKTGAVLSTAAIVSTIEASPSYVAPASLGSAALGLFENTVGAGAGSGLLREGIRIGGLFVKTKTLVTVAVLLVLGLVMVKVVRKEDAPEQEPFQDTTRRLSGNKTNQHEVEEEARDVAKRSGLKQVDAGTPVAEEETTRAVEVASLKGRAFDASNKEPVKGALIRMINWETGYAQYEAKTGFDGTFQVPGIIPETSFLLIVVDDKYKLKDAVRRSFHPGEASEIELPLVLDMMAQISKEREAKIRKVRNYQKVEKTLNAIMVAQEEYRAENQTYVLLNDLKDRLGKWRVPAVSDFEHHDYLFTDIGTPASNVYAICARPKVYGETGDYTLIINDQGLIFHKDNGGSPVMEWPVDWKVLPENWDAECPEGKITHFYENGQKEEEFAIQNGHKEGICTRWRKNGQVEEEGSYRDGKKDGSWIGYSSNGQKVMEQTYQAGKLEGAVVEWYPNGQKATEGQYKRGILEGRYARWNVQGQRGVEGEFRNGNPIGLWTFYDERGNVIRNKTYTGEELE